MELGKSEVKSFFIDFTEADWDLAEFKIDIAELANEKALGYRVYNITPISVNNSVIKINDGFLLSCVDILIIPLTNQAQRRIVYEKVYNNHYCFDKIKIGLYSRSTLSPIQI
jgi:hypothetical protein